MNTLKPKKTKVKRKEMQMKKTRERGRKPCKSQIKLNLIGVSLLCVGIVVVAAALLCHTFIAGVVNSDRHRLHFNYTYVRMHTYIKPPT